MQANLAYWQRQYLYVLGVLVLLLPTILTALAYREIDAWYARTVFGPALEQELGFHTRIGPHPAYPKERGEGTWIDYVEPGGVFDRAGVQWGDMPDQRCSICNFDIYSLLEWNRGGYALIDVFRRSVGSNARPQLLELRVPLLARPGVCMREGQQLVGVKPIQVGGKTSAPHKLRDVRPAYPTRDVETRGSGMWMADVLIDQEGDIRRVWVLREPIIDPPWPEFDEALVSAVRQWKYEPTIVRGRRVPVCMTVNTILHWY